MAVHALAPPPVAPVSIPAPRDEHNESDWTGPPSLATRNASPPRVNPYHLIHHPGSDELLPPLPPHLQRIASGETPTDDETSDSDSSSDDDDDFGDDADDEGYASDQYNWNNRERKTAKTPNAPVAAATAAPHAPYPSSSPNPYAPQTYHSGSASTADSPPPPFALGEPPAPRSTRSRSRSPAPSTPPIVIAPEDQGDTRPRRIMKKVSSVFRRGDPNTNPNAAAVPTATPPKQDPTAMARLSPMPTGSPQRHSPIMMQGPPPSPPPSDISDVEYASSIAVTEATESDRVDRQLDQFESAPPTASGAVQLQPLMPLAEAGESKVALDQTDQPTFAINLTAEPESRSLTAELESRSLTASPLSSSPPRTSFMRPAPASPDPTLDPPRPSSFLGIQKMRRGSGGSTSSRAGSLSMVRSGRLAPQRDSPASPALPSSPAVPSSSAPPHFEVGAPSQDREHERALHPLVMPPPPPITDFRTSHSASSSPSSVAPPRLQRHNTNPTMPSPPMVGSRPLSHSVSISHQPQTPTQYDGFNLPADILAQTEILRRERLERRQKKMSLLAAATPVQPEPTPEREVTPAVKTPGPKPPRRKETDDAKVLVGNLVGEGHRNYILMYNMLTGIRVAVSRCQAKLPRPLTDEDYAARHKYSFDIVGNELTPSARYDFKFKDYAPWVFRELREEFFHIDPADYLLSLTAKYILSELGSPGKSGSFFYYSRDYRFIIKTISHSEHNFLRSILKDYHEHVRANPHTLLSRFYGLHRVKMPRGRKIHFVIMNNLFPPHRDIHETYDLKGSAWGREYPEEKAKENPRAVLKDKNWVNRGRTFEFGPEKRALLTEQLRRDMEFLKRIRVMDYSLLVGIHNMERGNRDNLRENTLVVFQPDTNKMHRKPSAVKPKGEASNIRRAVARSDPKRMLDVATQLPSDGPADRRHFLFYQDEGGLRATDEQNNPMDIIYYLGVIDICTPYNISKRVEHAWKSMTENGATISCVPPATYGHRFIDFLMSVMRGGDVALRPEGLETPKTLPGGQVGCDITAGPGAPQGPLTPIDTSVGRPSGAATSPPSTPIMNPAVRRQLTPPEASPVVEEPEEMFQDAVTTQQPEEASFAHVFKDKLTTHQHQDGNTTHVDVVSDVMFEASVHQQVQLQADNEYVDPPPRMPSPKPMANGHAGLPIDTSHATVGHLKAE